jgi:methylenetetrahydrofolate dehydrogenase (NADP+)/methenyltetrahydrofolate cyclohydrolase
VSATILDGKAVAAAVKSEVAARLAGLGWSPGLATILVGEDPASQIYVGGKRRDAMEVGIRSIHHQLPADSSQDQLEELIARLNADPEVDAILVQLPLPKGLDSQTVVGRIRPDKDADGLHPRNLGLLLLERPGLRPCTPSGILRLLSQYHIPTAGARVVVIGRSFLVGRPLALMLSAKGADATVCMAHSRTKDLAAMTREADIVVAAAGVPGLVTAAHVRRGATVIDVGINRVGDRLVGDVAFEEAVEVAGAITPVPGGVGPMTRAMLLVNTVAAAEAHRRHS